MPLLLQSLYETKRLYEGLYNCGAVIIRAGEGMLGAKHVHVSFERSMM